MTRGRMVAKTIRTDRALNGVQLAAEYLFLKTIPQLDRDGLILADTLWADTMPLRPQLQDRIPELIDELVAAGLILRWPSADGDVLYFPKFRTHQTNKYIDEAVSTIPLPEGATGTAQGVEWGEAGPPTVQPQGSPRVAPGPPQGSPESPDKGYTKVTPVEPLYSPETSKEKLREVNSMIRAAPASHPADQLATTAQQQPPAVASIIEAPAVQVVDVETAAATTAVRPAVFDRLQKEWLTVNPTQHDGHSELAEKYGYQDWLQGFNTTKPGARSRPAYVEKVIISEIERLAGPEESGRVNYGAGASLNALDRVLEKKRQVEAQHAARNDNQDAVRQLPEHASVGGNGSSIPAAAEQTRPRIFGVGGAMAGGERGGQGAAQHRANQSGSEGA